MKKSKAPTPVHPHQTVSEALSAICRHNLDYLIGWEDAARSWETTEGVHQMRVAFRRTRSALSTFRNAIPKSVSGGWSEELRWLAGELGPARDLDVFIEEGLAATQAFIPLSGGDRLRELAKTEREKAYGNVRTMLDSSRYAQFKAEFPLWVTGQHWLRAELSRKNRKCLQSEVTVYARKLLDRQERKVLSAGTAADPDDAAEMHSLRIQCKKLRYSSEFFQPLFPGMDEFILHMKGLQDLLGAMNDISVMRNLLEKLLVNETDEQALQFAGGLIGWRVRQLHEMKDTFEDRWNEFHGAKHPWWTKRQKRSS